MLGIVLVFVQQKFCVKKECCARQKFWAQKDCGSKEILSPKKILDLQNFEPQKDFGLTKIFGPAHASSVYFTPI